MKTSINKSLFVTAIVAATSFNASAAAVDLSTWVGTAGGTWTVQSGDDAVFQSVNGSPTFFYKDGSNAQGTALSGKIKVSPSWDDDYIGFALGLDASDLNSSAANYILIDWKQGNQDVAKQGLAISHVTDSTINGGFWGHVGGVKELKRGTNLADTGWVDGTEYSFDLQFTSSIIQVSVGGVLELSIRPSDAGLVAFDDGAFAFYNYSQGDVLYSAIEEDEATVTVPDAGSSALLLGLAFLPIALKRRLEGSRN